MSVPQEELDYATVLMPGCLCRWRLASMAA